MFADDIVTLLVNAGLGLVAGTNIGVSSAWTVPIGMGPYVTVTETGGFAPTRVHNRQTADTQRPSAQILVRAGRIASVQEAYPAARAMSKSAYLALDGLANLTVNGTFYQKIVALQEPNDMGLDSTGERAQVVFNVNVEKDPS